MPPTRARDVYRFVDLWEILKRETNKVPGLKGKQWVFLKLGIHGWFQLGELTTAAWLQLEPRIPQKRIEYAEIDLPDVNRLGPGHLHSLEQLHGKARACYLQYLAESSRSRSRRKPRTNYRF